MSPLISLEEGLQKYGLTPGDVKQVIVTHLHFDYIALSRKYINATFISTFIQTPAMRARGMEVAAAGLHTDCREVYDSALKVKQTADIIVPLHDPLFMETERIGK
jgi:glyoxylase-like metal-dependent hydrolase (beta-lactamase superfamily II)